MSDNEQGRLRHDLPEIGIKVDLYSEWPVLSLADVGVTGIYQPIADTTGIVFVRHGAGETVDAFVQQLGGMLTEVLMIGDESLTVAGCPARRVTMRMVSRPREVYRDEADQGITHETLPAEHTVLTVIGFNNRSIPILAGYRIPEESLELYKDKVENILNSISASR